MYNSYSTIYQNAMLGGYYGDEDDTLTQYVQVDELENEYHAEDPWLEEVDPREELMGEIVNREQKLYIILNQLLSKTNLVYNNQVIEATGGSGQGTSLSPDLYNFVEEFAVNATCLKSEVPRDRLSQYVDDICVDAPTY